MVEIAKAMDLMMETTYSPTIICCIGVSDEFVCLFLFQRVLVVILAG